jgi:hypothetical protein
MVHVSSEGPTRNGHALTSDRLKHDLYVSLNLERQKSYIQTPRSFYFTALCVNNEVIRFTLKHN